VRENADVKEIYQEETIKETSFGREREEFGFRAVKSRVNKKWTDSTEEKQTEGR